MQRLYDALGLPIVPHHLTYCANDPLECCLTDKLFRPHLRAQLLPGNHPVTVLQQAETYPEHLRPQPNGLPTALQRIQIRIQFAIGKPIDHGLSSPSRRDWITTPSTRSG